MLSWRRLRRSGMKPLLTVLTGIAPGRCLDRELVGCSLATWSRYRKQHSYEEAEGSEGDDGLEAGGAGDYSTRAGSGRDRSWRARPAWRPLMR